MTGDLEAVWDSTIKFTQEQLLETLLFGIEEKRSSVEEKFWSEVKVFAEERDVDSLILWISNLIIDLEHEERKILKRKKKKKQKLCGEDNDLYFETIKRLDEHKDCFLFTNSVKDFSKGFSDNVQDIVNLASLSFESVSSTVDSPVKNNMSEESVEKEPNFSKTECEKNENDRYIGKFVSSNVVNISNRNLSKAEISLLSKGLKFVPTPLYVDRAKLKEELEKFGRKLRLLWHFRDDDNNSVINPFRPKSKFNPKGNDAAIEIYLSRLEEEINSIDTKLGYNNLTREERGALKDLRNDQSIVIKEADKGSGVVVWDREDYLAEAFRF